MITLAVDVPYASFRKSFARSFAETYPLPPPATIYGMLLSLVGERFRVRHTGVRLAFAYKCSREDRSCSDSCMPRIATTLRKLTRFKYGVGGKEGSKPDFVETLCGIEFLCWIDSSAESSVGQSPTLETRILEALCEPEKVNRYGVLCLGLSDDAVNEVSLCKQAEGRWHRLVPSDTGMIELPVWVNHTGSTGTRWQRYQLESNATELASSPGEGSWAWTAMIALP